MGSLNLLKKFISQFIIKLLTNVFYFKLEFGVLNTEFLLRLIKNRIKFFYFIYNIKKIK